MYRKANDSLKKQNNTILSTTGSSTCSLLLLPLLLLLLLLFLLLLLSLLHYYYYFLLLWAINTMATEWQNWAEFPLLICIYNRSMLDGYTSSRCFFFFVYVEIFHLLYSYFETRVVSTFKKTWKATGESLRILIWFKNHIAIWNRRPWCLLNYRIKLWIIVLLEGT